MYTNQTIHGTWTALTPILHNNDEVPRGFEHDSKYNNRTYFRREQLVTPAGIATVPVISGNAVRGIMRRLMADDLLAILEIDKAHLPEKLYHLLYAGGGLEKNEKKEKKTKKEAPFVFTKQDLRNWFPLISLLGCSLFTEILSGKVMISAARPHCLETNAFTGADSAILAKDLTQMLFYTRKDDLEELEQTEEKTDSTQMIYHMEALLAGTTLAHELTIKGEVTDIEQDAFLRMIRLFQERSLIGGRSAIGHGKLHLKYEVDSDQGAYVKHVQAHKAEILTFFEKVFEWEGEGALLI